MSSNIPKYSAPSEMLTSCYATTVVKVMESLEWNMSRQEQKLGGEERET